MGSTSDGTASYDATVSAWAAHLRDGGTTTWQAWRTRQPLPTPDRAVATLLRPVPDAIHLELVRRLNLAVRGGDWADVPGLADRVLATASPGRGLLDVPLPWPGSSHRFGTPARAPEALPAEELVRLAVGVLGHLLPLLPPPAAASPPSPWPAPWRRRFRLHGAPATVAAVRRTLLDQGHVETDWRPTHVVIARPVEVMMAEHWSTSVRNGGILKWSTTWRRAEAAGRLPDPIDVAAIADGLRNRRREPLHVVVARDADHAATMTAGILRTRPAVVRSTGDAALCDLLRRLNKIAALAHGSSRAGVLARTLIDLLERGEPQAGTRSTSVDVPLGTPMRSLPWAREIAAAAAEALRGAGYAVHGDPDDLAPTAQRRPGTVDRERTLELALTACLLAWHQGGNQ